MRWIFCSGRHRTRNILLIALLGPLLLASVWRQEPVDSAAAWLAAARAGERRVPIYSVATPERKLAISFDAAWGADKTPRLLEILDEFQVKTTFFLVTFWIEDYPEMAREIVARGHEIGMHSSTHPDFTALSRRQIREELERNADTIRRVTGYSPKLFRPPFGAYSNRVIEVVEDELGYTTIQWSIDSLDWKNVSPEFILERVLRGAGPGEIVLFHNNAESTPVALPRILGSLRDDGYEIVPISELIHRGRYRIDHEGRQIPLDRR